MIFGRIAWGAGTSEDPSDVGAARLPPTFAPSVGAGIDVAFGGVVAGPRDPAEVPGVDLAAIKLIATTCESDFNLCCGSVVSDVPTEYVAVLAEVVVEDTEDDDVVIVLPLELLDVIFVGNIDVLSTVGETGAFETKCECCDRGSDALFGGK